MPLAWPADISVACSAPAQNDELVTIDQLNKPRWSVGGDRTTTPFDRRDQTMLRDFGADLLLVDGDPLDDVGLISAPEENLLVIMKDGTIVKNTLK
jgi:hypothetical protein